MQNRNNYRPAAGANKPPVTPRKASKKKKKSNAYKPRPWLMVVYWVLGLLMLVFAYLKVKHFFTTHW